MKLKEHVEFFYLLVKQVELNIIANDYDYALAA